LSFPFYGFNGLPLKFGVIRVFVMIRLEPWFLFSIPMYKKFDNFFQKISKITQIHIRETHLSKISQFFSGKNNVYKDEILFGGQ
jgi:hypothetical protein